MTPRCGTSSAYRHGCRCDACTEAHSAYLQEQKERRLARAAADPSVVPHGTRSAYTNWNCRCQPCMDAYREHRNSPQAASRQQPWTDEDVALALSDRPIAEIAAELGRSYQAVTAIRYTRRPRHHAEASA